jgi:hypothetical protein
MSDKEKIKKAKALVEKLEALREKIIKNIEEQSKKLD